MILQALTKYYEDLVKQGKVQGQGWGPIKISFALCIDAYGRLEQIVPTMQEEVSGRKSVLRPQTMTLPAAIKKTSGALSNFLWENSGYLLGIDQKGKPERSKVCFRTAAELHHKILDDVDSTAAKAILKFFDTWDVDNAASHSAIIDQYDEITSGGNLLFRVDGCYAQDDPDIRAAWQQYNDRCDDGAVRMQCLITGKEDEIPAVHPSIKGVRDAQSSGAALISFNASAFCSYGHEQNFNAPVGKYAAFAYTSALNHLLADRANVQYIGDTTVVCWADGADQRCQEIAIAALFGEHTKCMTEEDLRGCVKKLANGIPCDEIDLDPDKRFYILGLAPNAARLSVRFFLCDSFGRFMKNINDHYNRLDIVKPPNTDVCELTLWGLLRETVNPNSKDKAASPVMAGSVMRAVFSGSVYPASLLEAVMLRIRAERRIDWKRAAIIKAYYLKNNKSYFDKEILTVALNEKCTDIAYLLGRLFAVYEMVQKKANPGINATIRDKYFNSAAAMPASIFPILNNLYQKHLRKLDGSALRIFFDKQVGEIKDLLGETYPARMSLAQQGSFDLGYYHQTQKMYEKKEDK